MVIMVGMVVGAGVGNRNVVNVVMVVMVFCKGGYFIVVGVL